MFHIVLNKALRKLKKFDDFWIVLEEKGFLLSLSFIVTYFHQLKTAEKLNFDDFFFKTYLLLRVFDLLPKINFWKGDWALGYVSTQI